MVTSNPFLHLLYNPTQPYYSPLFKFGSLCVPTCQYSLWLLSFQGLGTASELLWAIYKKVPNEGPLAVWDADD